MHCYYPLCTSLGFRFSSSEHSVTYLSVSLTSRPPLASTIPCMHVCDLLWGPTHSSSSFASLPPQQKCSKEKSRLHHHHVRRKVSLHHVFTPVVHPIDRSLHICMLAKLVGIYKINKHALTGSNVPACSPVGSWLYMLDANA